jgi:DICT domain-containing protein
MVDKKEILKELEKKFEETKKEINFKPTFEDLEKEFSITDAVLSAGFVSENFSRQLAQRIVDHFRDWHGYLNNLLLPNPSYIAGQTESKLFNSEDERKKIWKLITISMKFSSFHSLTNIEGSLEKDREFIDEAYNSWINVFKPGLIYLLDKVYEGWKKE